MRSVGKSLYWEVKQNDQKSRYLFQASGTFFRLHVYKRIDISHTGNAKK